MLEWSGPEEAIDMVVDVIRDLASEDGLSLIQASSGEEASGLLGFRRVSLWEFMRDQKPGK